MRQCVSLVLYLCLLILTTALRVEFSDTVYTGSEQSGFVRVTLVLRGGTSASDISVNVIPSDQSPVSAQGKRCVS